MIIGIFLQRVGNCKKEGIMVEVTRQATEQVGEYFKNREISPIRIFLNEGGWGGPSLAMALDEPRNTDDVFNIDGFEYIVDKQLLERAQPIKVDFQGMGFKLDCGIDFSSAGGCSGCASASNGCGA